MASLRMPLNRLHRSIRRRGLASTVRQVMGRAIGRVQDESVLQAFVKAQDGTFDEDYNVDSAGFVKINELDTVGKHRADAVDYQATSPALFREMLAKLDIDFPAYTFIDIGAGKGRALLLAASHPFRRIIGVEFAPSLCEVASRNLASYTGPVECDHIEVVCADVDDYALPPGPIVFFLYNTFASNLTARFAQRVLQHCAGAPVPSFVLYCDPEHAGAYDTPSYSTIATTEGYRVFRVEGNVPAPNSIT